MIYGGNALYSPLHFCADMRRRKALALISKAKKHIIVIFVFNERKIYDVMLPAIRQNAVAGAKFKRPVQNRFVNAQLDLCLYRFPDVLKIQNRLWIIPGHKDLLSDFQV